MKCKKCGGELEIDFTKILTSLPAKYEAKCKDCGDITYLLCSECYRLNELDDLGVNGTNSKNNGTENVYIKGLEVPTKETGQIDDVLLDEESITKIKSNYPYNYQKPINETCGPNYYYESNKPTDIHSGFYQQGWVCPKCGGVYSPYQNYCPNCSPTQNIKVTN